MTAEEKLNTITRWLKLADEFPQEHIAKMIVGELCDNCFYKDRYSPAPMYDSDFGRVTGTHRPNS